MVFWRSGAKLSEILATVVATSVVWSVDKTRCPVSAAATAILILSASRISPTTITSGACLTAARNAVGKSGASVPISTCSTMLRRWRCSYSIGSSTMTMCRASFWLISLTRAANVVDFPDPAGPPTRSKPRGNRARERTEAGRCKASKVGTDEGRARIAAAGLPRSLCKFILNLPDPLTRYEESAIPMAR